MIAAWYTPQSQPKQVYIRTYADDMYLYTAAQLDTWTGYAMCSQTFEARGVIVRHVDIPC